MPHAGGCRLTPAATGSVAAVLELSPSPPAALADEERTEALGEEPPRRHLRAVRRGGLEPAVIWALGFGPVLYLALRGAGYDITIYSEIGLAAAWFAAVLALRGLARGRVGRAGWICIGLLAAFVIWTGASAAWSASAGRTVTELGRDATYLAVFVLAMASLRRTTARVLVSGIGCAFALVALLAVLSRLYPGAFPHDAVVSVFPGAKNRLNYPLNYADGTGNFVAIGMPLLLWLATRAKTLAGRALASAALPPAILAIVMSASRGGVITAVVGCALFYLLADERLPKLVTGFVVGAGGGILVLALLHFSRSGVSSDLAASQRHDLFAATAVVCLAVALAVVAIEISSRRLATPSWISVSRRRTVWISANVLAAVVAVSVAAGLPGALSHQWDIFKSASPVSHVSTYSRLTTVAGSNRYQYWQAAGNAFDSKPLNGIGAGTFEFWWDQHATVREHVVNAHSLYLETLAETGVIGFALLVAFLLVVLGAGVVRALRPAGQSRALWAGATAAFAAFITAAAYDWVWQLPAIPVAALLLAGALVGARAPGRNGGSRAARPARAGLALTAIVAVVAIAIPFATSQALRDSQRAAGAGQYRAALSAAATAQNLEPYAAAPRLQRALVLEAVGSLPAAREAAITATEREPTNWQVWLIRARIEAEAGMAGAAARDYDHAHRLYPISPSTSE